MSKKPTYEELEQRVRDLERGKGRHGRTEKRPFYGESPAVRPIEPKMSPKIEPLDVPLASVIDTAEIQAILDEFFYLTDRATAILDLDGGVIQASGWQDICTRFHRVNPDTACNCRESDLHLSENLEPGHYAAYKCRNGLWDVVTPLYIGEKHYGNLYTGQFFYDDESINEELFIKRAEIYGFDGDAYLEALKRVPRLSRESVDHLMRFLVKFTTYVSRISLANMQLEKEIAERLRVEDALSESETHLRSLIRTIPDLVWLKDINGVYLLCNSRFEDYFGAKEKDIVGKTDYDFVDKEQADFFRKNDHMAMKIGKSFRNEEYVTFANDGHQELLDTIKTPMYKNDGQLAGVLGIGRDITDQRKANEEKDRLEEKFHQAQKVESIGRLAGGVAHDLNNLLSPVIGYGEMLEEYFSPGDEHREYVEEILKAGFRARDLVQQLLAFSRKQTLEYKPLNLNEVIKGFKKLLNRTIREDIKIEFSLLPDIPIIMADIGQIEQVIMNLAVNAADSMQKGGKMTIETALTSLDENYVDTHEDVKVGNYVVLVVSDTGCGMEESVKSQIFEPFYSTKGDYGTGLGLATVYGIVKQHNGDILVTSKLGEGTTFKVFLPVSLKSGDKEGVEKKPVTDLRGSETILLVEDNKQVRELARNVLMQQGYDVIVAPNGAKALDIINKVDYQINLLLTDVIMPGINGKELFEKAAEMCPGLKVVFMSGYTGSVIALHGVLEDGQHFIQKPFSLQTLSLKVREALDETGEI